MEGLVVTWRELLIVVITVLAVYVAEVALLLRWSGRTRRWAGSNSSSAEQRLINNLTLELGELRRHIARMQAEIEQLKSASLKPLSPYTHAIQMAREGRSAAEVASTCGISRGEAELILALHRKLRI